MSGRRRRHRGPDPLVQIGRGVRAARLAQRLTEPALARRARVGERTLRRLQAGQGGHAAHLLQVLGALGCPVDVPLLLMGPLQQRVLQAALAHVGADWLGQRPALSASEARLLAQDLREDLWGGRWQGGAETARRALLKKLRQMGPPPRRRKRP